MLFVRLVPVRANGGFPAKRQEFKVEWSTIDTESDRIHCSSVSAGDPANGHFPGYVLAIRADENYPWVLSSLHFCELIFVLSRKIDLAWRKAIIGAISQATAA